MMQHSVACSQISDNSLWIFFLYRSFIFQTQLSWCSPGCATSSTRRNRIPHVMLWNTTNPTFQGSRYTCCNLLIWVVHAYFMIHFYDSNSNSHTYLQHYILVYNSNINYQSCWESAYSLICGNHQIWGKYMMRHDSWMCIGSSKHILNLPNPVSFLGSIEMNFFTY